MAYLRAHRHMFIIIGIMLLALLLRCIRLNQPVWGDEIASWAFAQRAPVIEMWQYAQHDASPPLYYLLLHFSMPIFGTSPWALRIVSLICGVLLIPAAYWLARLCSLHFAHASAAALLVACSSTLIYYSQEARSYSLLALLSILATISVVSEIHRSRWIHTISYGLLLIGMLYTHYYGFFFLAAHGICMLIYRRFRMALTAAVIGSATMAFFALQIAQGILRYGPSGLKSDGVAFESLFTSLTLGLMGLQHVTAIPHPEQLAFSGTVLNTALLGAGWILSLGTMILLVIQIPRMSGDTRRNAIVLSICVGVPAILALCAGSPLSPHPQWLLRGLIAIWVLFPILLVIAWRSVALPVLVALLLALNGASLYTYFSSYVRFGEQESFDRLRQQISPDDLIVADPSYMADFIDYYLHSNVPIVGYSKTEGWVDIGRIKATNQYDIYTFATPPAVKGNIYVFYRAQIDWADSYPDKQIFIYDPSTRTWKPYRS